jgi:hypothetical protein
MRMVHWPTGHAATHRPEALVLFDLLQRWEADGTMSRAAEADAVARRLFTDISATLEPVIDEVFVSDYAERVERARREIT